MDTDSAPDLRKGGSTKLLLAKETEQIIGCAFEVLNEIGHGLYEKIYENGMLVAFKIRGISFEQQKHFPVLFREVQVGEFIPDILAFGLVIVDAKTIDRITDHEIGQMTNYLRITKLRVGLIINFKYARLQWERVVL
jgi:GxxExxY protein